MAISVQINQALTDRMVEQAIEECAEAHFGGYVRRLRQALLQGECEYCPCIANSLAGQIGDYLGQTDSTVKAVYQYEPAETAPHVRSDDTFDKLSAGFNRPGEKATKACTERRSVATTSPPEAHDGINLVAWVDRKSAALSALVETLEAALAASLRKLGCINATPGCFTLDVEMVDDHDVEQRRGFGLLVTHAGLYSKPLWTRPAKRESPSPVESPEARRVQFALPDAFDLDLIPESRLIEHAASIERVPPENRKPLEHHLTELRVTLIRRIISDQLAYINIAKRWFTVADLADIYRRRIGFGRVGGKSAGMLLAARILHETASEEVRACLRTPESYFLGSDLIYIFMAMNGLMHWNDQKYKPEDQIRAEYLQIREAFQAGRFPPEILVELQELLTRIGSHPVIVRSSSQLEDNFGTSFAGKYDSFFCPNQGTPEENLAALTNAIAQTYASTFKPEALLYRRQKGLQDYDERMAVLIQVVQGEPFGRYYLPHAAGVAFSRNLYRWSPQIRREDGFARLVWGLGTRAVQRTGDDYPRLVALSHPTLQPDDATEAIRHYSQQYVDLIDLQNNAFETLPIRDVLTPSYPPLRLIAQVEQDGFFVTPRMRIQADDLPRVAITYQEFLRRTPFASLLSRMLRLLEEQYQSAVDVEFTVHVPEAGVPNPPVQITLLQCRPQSHLQETSPARLPESLPESDVVFSTRFMVPQGYLPGVRYVIFVVPEAYLALPTPTERNQLGRVIAQLNASLEPKSFICVGPGRWGTVNTDLGVFVGYSDVCNAGALVELAGKGVGPAPEPSLGTHFFQDLMEAQIYPLAVSLDDAGSVFNGDFFYHAPNRLAQRLPEGSIEPGERIERCLRLIEVADFRPGCHLEVIMDDEKGQAVAFLSPDTNPYP